MKKPHPSNVPLEEWPEAWLKLQVANLSGIPFYIAMYEYEKRGLGLPVTIDEMRDYIRTKQNSA